MKWRLFLPVPTSFVYKNNRFNSQDLKVSAVAPNYNQQKYHKKTQPRKRSKKGGAVYIFWGHFWPIFAQKMRPKIEAKNDAKKNFKNHEI